MVGGAPGCTLMTVKIFGDDGGVTVSELVEAIEYAADNGADVMNLSLSTLFKNESLGIGVRYAIDRDV
ncbi:MAG: S8 family serine peptidase, partial [Blastocatellia bacterium]|nr:S8 family serine peptidase [Blastocatellia bacterium]